ncbi:methyltransferase domain-containing protein [Liquorilactobacillus capillatus]|uniref:rRNA large subunit methyltransferase A n=1 Tax=Liquorilactobacillus capillatus DSM 19910 TaxID=1423731 RepID=A0A0R1MDA3_9LACO|nr:methyltransferase domain-containing protein [Liquorilactobacillus capillatus]KRL03018.1 rRNA large subunit methyltransferase A [Liquorilactobacillus capillatus DSM 19910]
MKKIDRGITFVDKDMGLFKCPVCDEGFSKIVHKSIVCKQGHQLDFSKKGTLYFLKHGVKSDYDDEKMWQARRSVLTAGLFQPIIDKIASFLPHNKALKIVDAGCGEGSTLNYLDQQRAGLNDIYVGFDISKKAVDLATQISGNSFFCIADLAQLPFMTSSFDVIIDMFSPSSYEEFERVLKTKGLLIKVIPNKNYLVELRHMLYEKDDLHYSYSNDKVLTLFKQHYPQAKTKRLTYKFLLAKTNFESLLYMTPLHWGATESRISAALSQGLDEVTVDVSLLIIENN